jgi:hypothetical protein
MMGCAQLVNKALAQTPIPCFFGGPSALETGAGMLHPTDNIRELQNAANAAKFI